MLSHLLLPCLLLLTPADPVSPAPAEQLGRPSGPVVVVVDYLRTARLRKLHLVRPDLIPYPMAYDVYC